MKNNKGFTLIELLICITIIAALSVSISLGVDKTLKSAQYTEYKDLYDEIFRAAAIYENLDSPKVPCTNEDLACLIANGLLDEKILKKTNPITGSSFSKNDPINVNCAYGVEKIKNTKDNWKRFKEKNTNLLGSCS